MHSYYPSPILWGFISTKNSQSDSCLLGKDCVKTSDTEVDTHASKSVHDVTSGSTLDSMSWLSKLIKAKSDTAVKTVDVQEERTPLHVDENEISTENERSTVEKVNKSLIVIPRNEISFLSVPITKKRTRPITPEPESVDAESKKLKLVVGVHERDEKHQPGKYLGLTSVHNTSGNAKRKFEWCDDDGDDDDDRITKRVQINKEPDKAPGRILDPWPCLYGKPKSDPSKGKPTASCSNAKPDDVDADAEVASYMENDGPPTVKEYMPLQDKYMPVVHASYYAEQRPADVSIPGYRTVDGTDRQFGPPFKTNKDPVKKAPRILDPWPCLYGNTQSDPSKPTTSNTTANTKPEADPKPADVLEPGFRTLDGTFYQYGPPPTIYEEPSKKEPRILDPWPCLYGNKKSDPPIPTTSSYAKSEANPKRTDVSEPGFHIVNGPFYQYGRPPKIYGESSKKEPRILDPWPCLYGNKNSDSPKPTTSSYEKPEADTKPDDVSEPGFYTVDGTFYQYGPPPKVYREQSKKEPRILDPWPCLYGNTKSDSPKPTTSSYRPEADTKPADVSEPGFYTVDGTFYQYGQHPKFQREPSKKGIRILDPWPCLYGNTKTGPPKENLTGPSTQVDADLDAEVAMYMENGGPPTVLGYRLMPHKYIPHLRETNHAEQKPADPHPQAAYHAVQKPADPRLEAAYYVQQKPADPASYSGVQQKPIDPRLEAAYHVQQKPADPRIQASCSGVQQKPVDPRLQAAYHVQQKPADPRLQAAYHAVQKPADVALPGYYSADGCYHQFQSPRKINRKPNKEAIRLLRPWPCLYRNTKFGELKIVGTLNVQDAPQHWKRFPAKTCEQNLY